MSFVPRPRGLQGVVALPRCFRSKRYSRGFWRETLRNLPFFALARHGQPRDFRSQRIRFTLGPAYRSAVLALFQPGRNTSDHYSSQHGEEHDDIELHLDLRAFVRGAGEGIKKYGHGAPVGHGQGQKKKHDWEEKKELQK